MSKKYTPDELFQLSKQFRAEHLDADECMFDAYLDQRELNLEPDEPVTITDGILNDGRA